MNFIKLSILATSILLIGCGDDSKNDTVTKARTIEDATKNMKALNAIGNLSKFDNNNINKIQNLSKEKSFPCAKGGNMSIDISEDSTQSTIIMDECKQNDNSYIDGKFEVVEKDNGYSKTIITNYTLKDSNGEEFSTPKLIIEENDNEYWSTIDGDLKIRTKCFNGSFNIKTLEKMYDMKDGSDGVREGKIELNGATYDFSYPNVTIKTAGNTKTMTQEELDKEMTSATNCDI